MDRYPETRLRFFLMTVFKDSDIDLINQAFDQNVLNEEDNIELLKKFILSLNPSINKSLIEITI